MLETKTQQWTLEQVEDHLKKANLDQYNVQQTSVAEAQLDVGKTVQNVCGVYQGIKPVIEVLKNFPFIPASIKKALTTFMSVMDSVCPVK